MSWIEPDSIWFWAGVHHVFSLAVQVHGVCLLDSTVREMVPLFWGGGNWLERRSLIWNDWSLGYCIFFCVRFPFNLAHITVVKYFKKVWPFIITWSAWCMGSLPCNALGAIVWALGFHSKEWLNKKETPGLVSLSNSIVLENFWKQDTSIFGVVSDNIFLGSQIRT